MRPLVTWLLVLLSTLGKAGEAQQIPFGSADQRIIVFRGDTVAILADSAYVIGTAHARLLNQKLLELRAAHETNHALLQQHATLKDRVATIEALAARLLRKLQADHGKVRMDLYTLIHELDQSIVFLQQTNGELLLANTDLTEQLNTMDVTIRHLKRANRRASWQQVMESVLIALAAFGLGVLVGG